MAGIVTLKGAIISRYGNIANFAKTVNWGYSKARRIVCGQQEPGVPEIKTIVKALDISDPSVVMDLFLADCPQMERKPA